MAKDKAFQGGVDRGEVCWIKALCVIHARIEHGGVVKKLEECAAIGIHERAAGARGKVAVVEKKFRHLGLK